MDGKLRLGAPAALRMKRGAPAIALAATVGGLASQTWPGPERPGKLRLIALTVTCSAVGRRTGPAVGARAARGLQDLRADRLERVEVAALDAVVAHRGRAELQVELDAGGPPAGRAAPPTPAPRGSGRSPRACRRCTSRRRRCRCARARPVRRAPRRCRGRRGATTIGDSDTAIDADRVGIAGARVAAHPRLEHEVDLAALLEEAHRLFVGLDDAGEAAELGRHVGQRGALVGRQRAHHRRRRTRTPCRRRRRRGSRAARAGAAPRPWRSRRRPARHRARREAPAARSGAPRR